MSARSLDVSSLARAIMAPYPYILALPRSSKRRHTARIYLKPLSAPVMTFAPPPPNHPQHMSTTYLLLAKAVN